MPSKFRINSVYIFPDDSLIAEREHMTRVMGQPVKHPEPVILPDSETDRNGATFPSVHFDEEEQLFKAWYTAQHRSTERHLGEPLEDWIAPHLMAYATSRDGVHWEKPDLGQFEFTGSGDNNICDSVHAESVVIDPHDQDPARRYKRFMYDSSKRSLHLHFSADGLHWTWPTRDIPLFKTWDVVHDTNYFMGWDEPLGKYVAFFRPPVTLTPQLQRRIGVSMTEDVLNWPAPKVILEADEYDPKGLGPAAQKRDMDLYQMTGFRYGQGFLGFLLNFDAHLATEFNDPIYATLASSHDCLHWQRPVRSRFLSVGNPGSFDGGMVYPNCRPVEFEDELFIYYGGYPQFHAGWSPAHRAIDPDLKPSIGLARLRLDGFVGLYTNPYPGRMVTKSIEANGSRLLVNSIPDKLNGGWLKAEIQDEHGHPIEGYTIDDCLPVAEDNLYNEIVWRSGKSLGEIQGRRIRVCINQWENVFYGFRFAE
jgi:hypothetical protein